MLMVDMALIAGTASSIKTAYDIAKGAAGLARDADIQSALTEIQGTLMDAQSRAIEAQMAHATLIEQIRDLEKKVAQFEAWEAEAEKYQLIEVAMEVFAYTPKQQGDGGEPPHMLCANCYGNRKKIDPSKAPPPKVPRAMYAVPGLSE